MLDLYHIRFPADHRIRSRNACLSHSFHDNGSQVSDRLKRERIGEDDLCRFSAFDLIPFDPQKSQLYKHLLLVGRRSSLDV
jgi:hypothetical protein